LQMFAPIALSLGLGLAVAIGHYGPNRAAVHAVRPFLGFVLLIPLDQFLLGLMYFKMRDSLRGRFGSGKSIFRASMLAGVLAALVLGSGIAFTSIAYWDWRAAFTRTDWTVLAEGIGLAIWCMADAVRRPRANQYGLGLFGY
jgi:hypothetical protein